MPWNDDAIQGCIGLFWSYSGGKAPFCFPARFLKPSKRRHPVPAQPMMQAPARCSCLPPGMYHTDLPGVCASS